MNDLKKIILITGSSSGIGKSTVELLSKQGFQVIASMRNIKKNSNVVRQLKNLGDNVIIVELDVSSCISIKKAFEKILKKFGKIDVIVNNAGIMNVGLAEGFAISQLEKQMNVNYLGVARIFKQSLPYMKKRKNGLYITISSIAGRIVFPHLSTYNPSKFAVEALAEIYRYELSQFKIDSVIVEPGPFATDLIDNSPKPEDTKVLESYGELRNAPIKAMNYYKEFMKDKPECNPKLVSDSILKLINTDYGKRPLRTTCGIDFGVNKINNEIEKYQYELLKEMGMENFIPFE